MQACIEASASRWCATRCRAASTNAPQTTDDENLLQACTAVLISRWRVSRPRTASASVSHAMIANDDIEKLMQACTAVSESPWCATRRRMTSTSKSQTYNDEIWCRPVSGLWRHSGARHPVARRLLLRVRGRPRGTGPGVAFPRHLQRRRQLRRRWASIDLGN